MISNIIDYRKKWDYLSYKSESKKKIIFLHHTAGYDVFSAEDWLYKLSLKNYREKNSLVGVNYYIGKDGTIIYAIDNEKWAWHSATANVDFESKTISIELDNLGFMRYDDSKKYLIDLYNNKWLIKDKHKNLIYASFRTYNFEFIELEKSWRGFNIYHKYSESQINSLILLVDNLIRGFNIERKISKNFLPEQATLNSYVLKDFSGIVNHSQFMGVKTYSTNYLDIIRSYVKWDLSIVFPINEFKQKLNLIEI